MSNFTTRPVILGRHGIVTSGHYLATAAGFRILSQGGNAFDAATATCLALTLLEPQNCGLGGEAPTLIHSAREGKVYAISGMGWSAKNFTIEWCRQNGIDLIPGDGFLPACVPSTLDTLCLILARFGTLRFSDVAAPAIELAEQGYPVYDELAETITNLQELFRDRYPSSAQVYLPGGIPPLPRSVLRNPDWAATLRRLCQAEAAADSNGRLAGIQAARNVFYKGEVAARIIEFSATQPVLDGSGKAHTGLLSLEDMSEWQATLEEPVALEYHGLRVHKCSSWTQGPVFLQQLSILDGYNLKSMGHNSVDYLHTWLECAKLAFADREAYYGDPLFDDVPFDVLLSREYAAGRRALIDKQASPDLRPGDVGRGFPAYVKQDIVEDNRRGLGFPTHTGDTTHLDVVDAAGNMVACTPSGGWFASSPVIPGLGFPLGTRGQMFYLNPLRPNALAPHKRPRATLTPTLVTRDERPYLAFGTQGGDAQDQWTLQFFLNIAEFGMNLQEAVDAPSVHSEHFPSSFYPRDAHPNLVFAEGRIAVEVLKALEQRGHHIYVQGDWVHGRVMAVQYDADTGVLQGAASPKGLISYVMGW